MSANNDASANAGDGVNVQGAHDDSNDSSIASAGSSSVIALPVASGLATQAPPANVAAGTDSVSASQAPSTAPDSSSPPALTPAPLTPIAPLWKSQLLRSGKGTKGPIRKVLTNAMIPLRQAREWKGALRYNAFSHIVELVKAPPWARLEEGEKWEVRAWSDCDDILYAEWLQKQSIDLSHKIVCDAVFAIAKETEYHPVREYLNTLKWDGKPRLETWLCTYLGVEDSIYSRAVGSRWLISGIARIIAPGVDCKAECVLILEGEQGLLKSTALKTLSTPWFLDHLRKFSSKDAAMQITGRWIIELAELTAMNEVTVEACKMFFSQSMDSFRPPYGKRVIDAPRQCIFAASTNKNVFLKDETGDRRYWPVICTKGDIEALKRDRDQIWAEALQEYRNGKVWWLDTPELRNMAEDEQAQRFEMDGWEVEIKLFLRGRNQITPEQVWDLHFNKENVEINKHVKSRIASVLRHLRWHRERVWSGENRGEYVWVRKNDTRA